MSSVAKIKYLTAFNSTLKQFIDELYKLFPQTELFETAKNLFHTGLVMNKETYISEFYEKVYLTHSEQLKNQNSDFFAAIKDFDMFPETAEVRELYKTMSSAQIAACWKFVALLTKLTGKYYT
jgi:uncharacterized protein YjgD (DUF1641 family)